MSDGTRGIARHTIIYGLGTVLQKAVSFLMLPVYTRILTLEDYGCRRSSIPSDACGLG